MSAKQDTADIDQALLGEVFVNIEQRLRAYLQRYVERDDAQDLLQEVFLKALKTIRAGKVPANLPAWLFAAARTTAIDHLRARKKSFTDLDETALIAPETEQEPLENELAACLRPLANQLAPIYRRTLLGVDFEHQTMAELAANEGVSVSAIKSRAVRGRSMLGHLLSRCCQLAFEDGELVEIAPRARSSCCEKHDCNPEN